MIEFPVALLAIWAIFSLPSALVGAAFVWRQVFANPGLALTFVVVPWAAWLMFFLFVGRYGSLTTAVFSNVLVGLVEGVALTIIFKTASGRRARNIVLGAASLVAVLIWAVVPVMGE
jgi:hypothetical protein